MSTFRKLQIQLKRLFSPKDFESFILSAGIHLHLSECGKLLQGPERSVMPRALYAVNTMMWTPVSSQEHCLLE